LRSHIQSVEVSYFVHSTEDEARLEEAVGQRLGLDSHPVEERLEGHFGNSILHASHHLTGNQAEMAVKELTKALSASAREELLGALADFVDEHGTLYVRIDKQSFFRSKLDISLADPVRVKVKPRLFTLKESPEGLFRTMVGGEL
jgi:RNA binding exosome subunit